LLRMFMGLYGVVIIATQANKVLLLIKDDLFLAEGE